MKILLSIILLSGLLYQAAYASENGMIYISTAVNSSVADVKKRLEELMPENANIIYTFVPRGLIISVDESELFPQNSIYIKCSGANILNGIAQILNEIDNNCTIESHTDSSCNTGYHSNWEVSMARANSIADYLIYCRKIPTERVFPLGFGELMPFKDNVSKTTIGFDKRVDFVIFDYEYER